MMYKLHWKTGGQAVHLIYWINQINVWNWTEIKQIEMKTTFTKNKNAKTI